jgi:hypothetical protein
MARPPKGGGRALEDNRNPQLYDWILEINISPSKGKNNNDNSNNGENMKLKVYEETFPTHIYVLPKLECITVFYSCQNKSYIIMISFRLHNT